MQSLDGFSRCSSCACRGQVVGAQLYHVTLRACGRGAQAQLRTSVLSRARSTTWWTTFQTRTTSPLRTPQGQCQRAAKSLKVPLNVNVHGTHSETQGLCCKAYQKHRGDVESDCMQGGFFFLTLLHLWSRAGAHVTACGLRLSDWHLPQEQRLLAALRAPHLVSCVYVAQAAWVAMRRARASGC